VPNSNRKRGDYLEHSAKAALEAAGWLVIRAAGSYGPADLWAARRGELWLISCKLDGYVRPAERAHLTAAADKAWGLPMIASRQARGRVWFVELGGEAHADLPVPPRPVKEADDA
jgi:Holliday junction resolvase